MLRSSRTFLVVVLGLSALVALSSGARSESAAPPASAGQALSAPAIAPPGLAPDAAVKPAYGPIRSRDPLVRAQIKRLYLEAGDLRTTTMETVAQLNGQYRATTDPDFRFEISKKIADAKLNLLRRNMEIQLEIARLDNDAERIATFEKALDQLLHPEKYAPARPDPNLARQRMQEQGLK